MFGMTKQQWYYFSKNNLDDTIRHFEWHNMRDMFNFRMFDLVGRRLFRLYLKTRFFLTRKPSLSKIDIMNTTRCTMNCRDCCAFVPHYKSENHVGVMGFKDFKADLDRLLLSVDLIYILQFVGGEPLLDKELDRELEYAISKLQIRHIFITTNSTILPSSSLINLLKNRRCAVQLSNYSDVKTQVSSFYDQWLSLLKNNKIRYITYNDFNFSTIWSLRKKNDNNDKRSSYEKYRTCHSGGWRVDYNLANGKIYTCWASLFVAQNWHNYSFQKNDYIDIREENTGGKNSLTKAIIDWQSKPYYDFCQFCDFTTAGRQVPAGAQTKMHGFGFSVEELDESEKE
jgi:hypothetical protein